MSALNNYPDPKTADIIDGVIAVGGELDGPNLKLAYSLGIFPWPHEGYPLLWFCPDERGILEFSELHLATSFKKWVRKHEPLISVTINSNFSTVISECRKQKRQGQKGTWITSGIVKAYTELFKMGNVLSVECTMDGELVSGIYGVLSKNYFSCESMFFKKPNASKYAFVKLVEHLQSLGFSWMDLQMVTDVSGAFGGKYISREEFLQKITRK